MPVGLLERAPQAELADAGSGGQPPVDKLTAVAAEPPEGQGDKFDPAVERRRGEEDTAFANVVAGLGDVSLRGDIIAAAPHDIDPTSQGYDYTTQVK